jgi:hypothetical protein
MANERDVDCVLVTIHRTSDQEFTFAIANSHPSTPYHMQSYRADVSWYGEGVLKEEGKKSGKGDKEGVSDGADAAGQSAVRRMRSPKRNAEKASSLVVHQTDPPSDHRVIVFPFRNIPRRRLVDSAFWFLFYRPLTFTQSSVGDAGRREREGEEDVYERKRHRVGF